MQRLADILRSEADGTRRETVKMQGPFEGHNMAAAEESVYAHMLFFSGGVGITAILPMLVRSLRHRRKEPANDAAPSVTVVCACRNVDELTLLAPLLPFVSQFSLRIHFTGEPASLAPAALPAPMPLLGVDDISAQAEAGKGAAIDVADVTPKRKLICTDSRWLQLLVWAVAMFMAFWFLVRPALRRATGSRRSRALGFGEH